MKQKNSKGAEIFKKILADKREISAAIKSGNIDKVKHKFVPIKEIFKDRL